MSPLESTGRDRRQSAAASPAALAAGEQEGRAREQVELPPYIGRIVAEGALDLCSWWERCVT